MENLKFMSVGAAKILANRLADSGWNPRIEIAMVGEPSLHPKMCELVKIFRKANPELSLMIMSNGTGFLKGDTLSKIVSVFDSGLNLLGLDDYRHVNTINRIFTKINKQDLANNNIKLYRYPQEREGNPNKRRGKNERVVTITQGVDTAKHGTHAGTSTHAGFGSPPEFITKRCAKPFRELAIGWDGRVNVCCNDIISEASVGNVIDSSFEEVWQSDIMNAYRKYLYHGLRTERPCYGCTEKIMRAGLLPDKYGKEELPLPNDKDKALIHKVLSQGPSYPIMGTAMSNVYPILSPWLKKVWDKKRSEQE